MSLLLNTAISFFAITGCLILLISALGMFRASDALSRINVFSPATGLGMPMILVATYLYTLGTEGFSLARLFFALVTFLALISVSSVASNIMSRSTFVSGSPVSRKTVPNRLAFARDADSDTEAIALFYRKHNPETRVDEPADTGEVETRVEDTTTEPGDTKN